MGGGRRTHRGGVACGSALHVLLEVVESYKRAGVETMFVRLNATCQRQFELAGISKVLGAGHLCATVHDALAQQVHVATPSLAPALL